MLGSTYFNRKAASVPSLGYLSLNSQPCFATHVATEVSNCQDKACFSPVFHCELDAKLASSNHVNRCISYQQLGDDFETGGTTLLQQILALCRCASPVQAQLLQHLQRLRSCAGANAASTPSSRAGSQVGCGDAEAGVNNLLDADGVVGIETMARELLALGYMVQVRDGAQQQERSKTPRNCLQNLRHRFIVCLGMRSSSDGEPAYLPEPLVVEPWLREQFTIAHPTTEYEALLQSIPPCFVGPVAKLEGVVKLVCDQMVATFKLQGLPVPPWRTRAALLSKWSPLQLAELAAKIASLRHIAACVPVVGHGMAPCQSHEHLFNNDRPAAAHALHAAVGSAPLNATQLQAAVHVASASPWAQQQQSKNDAFVGIAAGTPRVALGDMVLLDAGWPQPGGGAAVLPPGEAASSQQPQHPHRSSQQTSGIDDHAAPTAMPQPGLVVLPHPALMAVWQQPATAGALADGAATTAMCEQPSTVMALGLAGVAVGNSCASPIGAALKFTRKASAEWKHQRSNGRKIKGLLAAALKKPVGSRGNLLPSAPEHFISPVLADRHAQNSVVGAASQQQPLAPVVDGGADVRSDREALIRRTHFRVGCDEPWRRITTVRLGGYPDPAPAQQQQVPQL